MEYPDINALDEAAVDGSPWSNGFDVSDRHVLLNIRWSAPDAVLDAVVRLAAKHGLVLFDPQAAKFTCPQAWVAPASRGSSGAAEEHLTDRWSR